MYSGDEDVDDSSLFICERHALTDLLDGLCLTLGSLYVSLTLGAHAQRGLQCLLCVSVGLCVCVSVSSYSRATGTKPSHERYQRL